ncbi:uncharacterized protein [Dermacentor albipictus]|uniref:uncharacterized protein isoform X2 n=1 Tax=Dermacentor albipictus TaxID=60249 RepID=UPI0031FE3927
MKSLSFAQKTEALIAITMYYPSARVNLKRRRNRRTASRGSCSPSQKKKTSRGVRPRSAPLERLEKPSPRSRHGEEPLHRQGLRGGERPQLLGDRGALHMRRGEPVVAGGRPVPAAKEAGLHLRLLHAVVERLREFLPPDSVIVYFKLELVPTVNDTEEATHEGIFGEFLFRVEDDASAKAPATTSEEADDQPWQQPDGAIPGPSWWRPRVQETQSVPPSGLATDLPGPSTAVAPLCPWPRRPRLAPGGERGALFRNVLPGVLVFQALHVTAANIEGNAVTSFFTEEATGRTMQVTSAAVFSVMPSSQLEPLMGRLSEELGSTDDAIAVVFPRNQDEVLGELEAFERDFPSVPALANQATEFNVDGQYAPMSRLKVILLLIKLLD